MIPSMMRWDELQRFNRTFIDNGDGTMSVRTTTGSSSGTNCKSAHRRDIARAFDRTIDSTFAIRTVS